MKFGKVCHTTDEKKIAKSRRLGFPKVWCGSWSWFLVEGEWNQPAVGWNISWIAMRGRGSVVHRNWSKSGLLFSQTLRSSKMSWLMFCVMMVQRKTSLDMISFIPWFRMPCRNFLKKVTTNVFFVRSCLTFTQSVHVFLAKPRSRQSTILKSRRTVNFLKLGPTSDQWISFTGEGNGWQCHGLPENMRHFRWNLRVLVA